MVKATSNNFTYPANWSELVETYDMDKHSGIIPIIKYVGVDRYVNFHSVILRPDFQIFEGDYHMVSLLNGDPLYDPYSGILLLTLPASDWLERGKVPRFWVGLMSTDVIDKLFEDNKSEIVDRYDLSDTDIDELGYIGKVTFLNEVSKLLPSYEYETFNNSIEAVGSFISNNVTD